MSAFPSGGVEGVAGEDARFRLVSRAFAFGMSAVLVILLGRVAQLQFAPSARLREQMTPRVSRLAEPPVRGDILDRDGRVLAATRIGHRVVVDPTQLSLKKLDTSMVKLAEALGVSPDELGTRIVAAVERNAQVEEAERAATPEAAPVKGKVRYLPVSGLLTDEQTRVVRELKIKGVILEKKQVREYPGGGEVASLIGKVGFEEKGLIGAEMLLEKQLAGTPGALEYVRDAAGRPLWLEPGAYTPPEAGHDTRLSIDLGLQRIGYDELQKQIEMTDAAGGRLVILDPMTGEILAMVDIVRELPGLAEYPWVDAPPARKRGDPPAPREPDVLGVERRYVTIAPDKGRKVHPALARNRCIEDIYEPGSTFKPFIWSTITELGIAGIDEVFDTEDGKWVIPGIGRRVEDVTVRATMTWREVLINSSNIGMIKGASRLTPAQMHDAMIRFGFGKPTGIGLPGRAFPGEAAGIVTTLAKWTKFTHTSVPYGHEVAVTPVQMVRAFSAFARTGAAAGTLPRLRLSAAATGEVEGVTYRVLPAEVAELTRETMRGVVANMEAGMVRREEEVPEGGWRYAMFGKSGTAEIPLGGAPKGKKAPRGSTGYYENQFNSSFIAGGPAENPRLVVLVVIDDPGPKPDRKHRYGSAAAGPGARRIMERALTYLGVPPSPKPEAPEL